jgi:hypothetical protein
VGVVGFVVSGAFAAAAKSAYNASLANCPHDPNICGLSGKTQRDDALAKANVATGAIVVGGVASALGIVLWFTAPAPVDVRVSTGLGSLTVSGRW